jgi:hypothetical protein
MIIPDTKEFYDPWYSPGDGCFVWFYPPDPTNPMLETGANYLCQYEKYLRK